MKCNLVVFKFEQEKEEFCFDENLSFVSDKKLTKNLGRENIKNSGSSLIIKSMNNLPIYDVIQIKINILDTCTLLANFDKENFDNKTREELISEIKILKDDVDPTFETQTKKISKVISILNKFNPIYATFKPHTEITVTFDDLKTLEQSNFILIYLGKDNLRNNFIFTKLRQLKHSCKKLLFKLTKKEKQPENIDEKPIKSEKSPRKTIDFKLFTPDYLFISIFTLLFTFGVYTGIFEILIKESISVFLLILAAIFLAVMYYAFYNTTFKRTIERSKNLKFYLLIYIVLGVILGMIVAYVLTTYVIKIPEDAVVNSSLIFGISIPVVLVLSLISPLITALVNKIVVKIKNK